MKRSHFTRCWLIGFVAAVVCLAGCGGGGIRVDSPEGYTRITIRGSASSRSATMNDLGELLAISDPFKDVGDGAGGTGTGGPESTADPAARTCPFSGPGDNLSEDGNIEIYVASDASSADCTDESNCIYCVVNASAPADYTISCDGLVASNSLIAADSFKFYLTAYHAFTTEMLDPDGMIRVDGDATSLDSSSLLSADVDVDRIFIPCRMGVTDSGNDEVTVSSTEGAEIDGIPLDTEANGIWHVGYEITELDESVGEGSLGSCHIEDKLQITVAMTGADMPDASINLTFDTITMTATICDSQAVCDEYTPE